MYGLFLNSCSMFVLLSAKNGEIISNVERKDKREITERKSVKRRNGS